MRIVDLDRKKQVTGLSLLITRSEAAEFLEQLLELSGRVSRVGTHVQLVGQDDSVRPRTITLVSYDPQSPNERLPVAYRKLADDLEAEIQDIDIPPFASG